MVLSISAQFETRGSISGSMADDDVVQENLGSSHHAPGTLGRTRERNRETDILEKINNHIN